MWPDEHSVKLFSCQRTHLHRDRGPEMQFADGVYLFFRGGSIAPEGACSLRAQKMVAAPHQRKGDCSFYSSASLFSTKYWRNVFMVLKICTSPYVGYFKVFGVHSVKGDKVVDGNM